MATDNTGNPSAQANPQTKTARTGDDVTKGEWQAGEVAIPVVKEELAVGKREVENGGVRVANRVVAEKVEAQVDLREEHVYINRRPVDRAASPSDLDGMKNGESVELVEHAEEPVVAKTARVVEEVVVGKNVERRTETVSDTLRHNVVDVERVAGTRPLEGARGYETYARDFEDHYQKNGYSKTGYGYEQFSPAYRYGYDLATSNEHRNRDWSSVESDARARWEGRNPGSWESVKAAVRHAWEKVSG